MTELAARGLSLVRGGRTILDDVSFRARAGDFVAVIGANGAGKSTLLSVLAGLLKPDAGVVALDARPIADFSAKAFALRRAYLPQNPRCEWPIAVERLVALGLMPSLPAFGAFSANDEARLMETLRECDLLAFRRQPATTLSGGELARAMLARALVGDPDIVIADEPIAGLDPRHALDTAHRLQTLSARGKLVIAALHDVTLAARYATRIVALRAGKVLADGATAQVLRPDLLRRTFDVDAHVSGVGQSATVDFRERPHIQSD